MPHLRKCSSDSGPRRVSPGPGRFFLLHLLHSEGGDPAQDRSPERAIEQRAEVGLSRLPAWYRLWGAQSTPRQVIEEIADADAARSRRATTHQPGQQPAEGIGTGASASRRWRRRIACRQPACRGTCRCCGDAGRRLSRAGLVLAHDLNEFIALAWREMLERALHGAAKLPRTHLIAHLTQIGNRLVGGEALRGIAGHVALDELLAAAPSLGISLAPLARLASSLPFRVNWLVRGIRSCACSCVGLVASEQLAQNPVHFSASLICDVRGGSRASPYHIRRPSPQTATTRRQKSTRHPIPCRVHRERGFRLRREELAPFSPCVGRRVGDDGRRLLLNPDVAQINAPWTRSVVLKAITVAEVSLAELHHRHWQIIVDDVCRLDDQFASRILIEGPLRLGVQFVYPLIAVLDHIEAGRRNLLAAEHGVLDERGVPTESKHRNFKIALTGQDLHQRWKLKGPGSGFDTNCTPGVLHIGN